MSKYHSNLSTQLFSDIIEHLPNRKGFGEGLVYAGDQDERVVALCADLTESTQMEGFKNKYPERFVEMGIAEQNMTAVAAGLAAVGKTPFISSYAAFSPGRSYDQIRVTISMNEQPVIVVGSHAGVSVGPDGATHQMLEDIAMMRALPNISVIVPCDYHEAKKATIALAQVRKPAYLRLAREKSPVVTTPEMPFQIGKAQVWREGADVCLIVAGPLAYEVLKAAEKLAHDGVEATVINNPSIKPLDEDTILEAAKHTGAIVTIEEAQVAGGLGGAVAELLSTKHPVPLERIGMNDTFGQSGNVSELWKHYGLTAENITKVAHRVMRRKSKK
jgi:transketolase